MVALTYEDLGGISGVITSRKVPGSARSRDRNAIQRMAFSADPNRPFTGIIHVRASVGDPTRQDTDIVWFDIAEIVIDNEGGTWSYEPVGEFTSISVECRVGDYWSAAHGTVGAIVGGGGGTFTINGNAIAVSPSDSAAIVAAAINLDANIIADGTIVADVVLTTSLRIYKTDGADLILVDTINTPLADLGITPGTFQAGAITAIRMLR